MHIGNKSGQKTKWSQIIINDLSKLAETAVWEEKEKIWFSPMTKALKSTEKNNMTTQKTQAKTSIT